MSSGMPVNGRLIALHLVCESVACAIMSAHRARLNASNLPKKTRRRVEQVHANLVRLAMALADDLTNEITK